MRHSRVLLAVLVTGLALTGCSNDKAGRKDGALTKAGDISVFDVKVGDCLMPGDKLKTEISDIRAVPCKEPHTHEVFALPEYPEKTDVYPGEAKLADFANASCLESFGNYTGSDYLDSKLFFSYLQPSVRSWNDGKDRRIVCVVVSTGKPVKGSVMAAGATGTTTKAGGSTGQKSKAQRAAESRVKAAAREKARRLTGLDH